MRFYPLLSLTALICIVSLQCPVNLAAQQVKASHSYFVDPALSACPPTVQMDAGISYLASHGKPGYLLLEGYWRDAAGIAAFIDHRHLLGPTINRLNILGCEFGKGEIGRAAVAYLQIRLGVVVSASDDITGRDGDWELEVGSYTSVKDLGNYRYNLQCNFGSFTDTLAVSWISNGNLDAFTTISENTQDDVGGKLFSDGANVVYSSSSGFQGGDTIIIRGNYQNDGRRGPLVLTSVGDTSLNSGPVMDNIFPANDWGEAVYVIPAGTPAFTELNVTGATNNGVYVNIDVIKLHRPGCYTCSINIAPELSDTTLFNSCPDSTYDLTTITASNTPAGAELTWHTATPATNSNRIADPSVVNGNSFYAAFFSTADSCYSGINGVATTTVLAYADYDCDGISNEGDIDDDNDGVPDKIECPERFANLAFGGGFTTSLPNSMFYMSTSASQYATSTSAVNTGSGNSTVTGGLFDLIDGDNTATGILSVSIAQNSVNTAFVLNLNRTLPANSVYEFAVDLGSNGASPDPVDKYLIELYDATSDAIVDTIASEILATLPGLNATPRYKTIGGTFTVPANAEYYILFKTTGVGNTEDDYSLDRVAVRGISDNVCDYDNDGIPNHLDLDSDGDNCYDKYESGVTGRTLNGTITDSLTIAYNTTGDAGANGLADTVESMADNGIVNYFSTYTSYALSNTIQSCRNSDNDDISDLADIDDDNDGVLDAVESPDCFYVASEADSIATVTSGLTQYSTFVIANAYDGNTATQSAFSNGQDWVDISVFEITPVTPVAVAAVNFDIGSWYLSGDASSTFKLQGFAGPEWEDLSPPMSNSSTTDFSIDNTMHPAKVYPKYRIAGVAGTCYFSGVNEITLTLNQYTASAHPKSNCTTDTDNDGLFNHLDLDSDGDGCPDAEEAGTYNQPGVSDTAGTVRNGGGGNVTTSISTDHAVIKGPYSGNGFADSLQTLSPGDTNTYRYTYNYARALDTALQACCAAVHNNMIDSNQFVCLGDAADTLRGTVPVLTRSGATPSYQWLRSDVSALSGFTPVLGATEKDYAPGVLTDSAWYKRVVTGDTCMSSSDTSAALFIAVDSCTPLPVHLLSFDAVLLPEGKGRITWIGVDEEAGMVYRLEKHSNGAPFVLLKEQQVRNSSGIHHYAYLDGMLAYGYNYYRLCMVSPEGNKAYSPVRVLHYAQQQVKADLFPNPAGNKLTFELELEKADALIRYWITDLSGRESLVRYSSNGQPGANKYALNVSELAKGVYLFHYRTSSGVKGVIRFSKTK